MLCRCLHLAWRRSQNRSYNTTSAYRIQAKLLQVLLVCSLGQLASIAVHPDDNKSKHSLKDGATCDTQEIKVPRMTFLNLAEIQIDVGPGGTAWAKKG